LATARRPSVHDWRNDSAKWGTAVLIVEDSLTRLTGTILSFSTIKRSQLRYHHARCAGQARYQRFKPTRNYKNEYARRYDSTYTRSAPIIKKQEELVEAIQWLTRCIIPTRRAVITGRIMFHGTPHAPNISA
jgi:hypothetical protein